MNNRYKSRMPDTHRNRLPNLSEILNRRTEPPVDLWSFYIFMRDQFRSVEYLDFWLDVVQHLSLCRHYVRGLRQSILANSERRGNSRTSSVLDTLIQEGALDDSDSHRLSMFLRGEDAPGSESLYRLSALLDAMNQKEQDLDEMHAATGGASRSEQFYDKMQNAQHQQGIKLEDNIHMATADTSVGSEGSVDVEKQLLPPLKQPQPPRGFQTQESYESEGQDNASFFSATSKNSGTPYNTAGTQYHTGGTSTGSHPLTKTPTPPPIAVGHASQAAQSVQSSQYGYLQQQKQQQQRQGSFARSNPADTIERLFPPREDSVADGSNTYVTRQNIKQSSQRILVTYFIPDAERELQLPARIVKQIKYAIEVDGRDDPEVFDEAREYVFQAMERDALPSFLASKALGNTNPAGSLTRLIIGLVSLFAAFWVGFILIFLDWKPKVTRLWLILPFGIGMYMILASLYNLDPLLALAGFTEAPAREGYLFRVKEPFVRRLLAKRALYVLFVIIVTAAIFVIIFALVPGKRL